MSLTLHDLGLDRLNREERIAVAHALLESVVEPLDSTADRFPITDAQRAELERRLEDSVHNPDAVTRWEVVRERAHQRART